MGRETDIPGGHFMILEATHSGGGRTAPTYQLCDVRGIIMDSFSESHLSPYVTRDRASQHLGLVVVWTSMPNKQGPLSSGYSKKNKSKCWPKPFLAAGTLWPGPTR